jgi:hypothetical protein
MVLVRGPSDASNGGAAVRWVAVAPFLTEMGHARRRPKRLAEKLLQVRKALDLSQREMVKRLGVKIPYKKSTDKSPHFKEVPISSFDFY